MQYRINYLLATITYFPFTVGFIFEEYMHGDINQTVAGGVSNRSSKKRKYQIINTTLQLRCYLCSRRRRQKHWLAKFWLSQGRSCRRTWLNNLCNPQISEAVQRANYHNVPIEKAPLCDVPAIVTNLVGRRHRTPRPTNVYCKMRSWVSLETRQVFINKVSEIHVFEHDWPKNKLHLVLLRVLVVLGHEDGVLCYSYESDDFLKGYSLPSPRLTRICLALGGCVLHVSQCALQGKSAKKEVDNSLIARQYSVQWADREMHLLGIKLGHKKERPPSLSTVFIYWIKVKLTFFSWASRAGGIPWPSIFSCVCYHKFDASILFGH